MQDPTWQVPEATQAILPVIGQKALPECLGQACMVQAGPILVQQVQPQAEQRGAVGHLQGSCQAHALPDLACTHPQGLEDTVSGL